MSGLARGIDGAVHSGTVDGGGATVAVLGCGIDRIYPSDHRNLAGKIIDTGGAVVSEYPPGEEPKKYYFPQRNRIISGLSRAVVLGQCPVRSGALITADYALEQGREVVVLAEGLDGGAVKEGGT